MYEEKREILPILEVNVRLHIHTQKLHSKEIKELHCSGKLKLLSPVSLLYYFMNPMSQQPRSYVSSN